LRRSKRGRESNHKYEARGKDGIFSIVAGWKTNANERHEEVNPDEEKPR
jgi:hypothetical protein